VLNRFSFKFKVNFSFLVIGICAVAMISGSYFAFKKVTSEYQKIVKAQVDAQGESVIPELKKYQEKIKSEFNTYISSSNSNAQLENLKGAIANFSKAIDNLQSKIRKNDLPDILLFSSEKMRSSGLAYLNSGGTESFTREVASFEKYLKEYQVLPKFTLILETALTDVKAKIQAIRDSNTALIAKKSSLKQGQTKLQESVANQPKLQEKKVEVNDGLVKKYINYFQLGFAGVAIVIVLAVIFALISTRITLKKLEEITENLRVSSQNTNESGATIQDILGSVAESATQQASSVQETVATLNEITEMAAKSVEHAQNSVSKSDESLDIASQGQDEIKNVHDAIENISKSNEQVIEQMGQSTKDIEDIFTVINEISDKTKVINDIVFQTKLLAFNASVEAARAGEHGKGFAVVAEEVGNLATMSGTASHEIEELISSSMNKVESTLQHTKKDSERLKTQVEEKTNLGKKAVDKCSKVLDSVVYNVEEVKTFINEIALACREQEEGVRNISNVMHEFDDSINKNSQSASVSAEVSEKMAAQTQELDNIISMLDFQLNGNEKGVKAPFSKVS
jgi:methyl-accepting chemotaxis protein